jgi:hypothetical protein
MRKILAEVGGTIQSDNGETLVFDVPLDAEAEQGRREDPLKRMLRAAAETMGFRSR